MKNPDWRVTHGRTNTPEYFAWLAMRQRCNNPNDARYERYGGRGIRVCQRWHKFIPFYEDVGPRPSAGHSIDRINNDGNYEPGNVRWATRSERQRNRNKYVYKSPQTANHTAAPDTIAYGCSRPAIRRVETYQARIKYRGIMLHLGTFKTVELARDAYLAKRKELYGYVV